MALFPQGTMRKSGVALVGASPFIGYAVGIGVKFLGVGEECTAEAVELGCMTADAIANSLTGLIAGVVSVIGGIMYWLGFNRANKLK